MKKHIHSLKRLLALMLVIFMQVLCVTGCTPDTPAVSDLPESSAAAELLQSQLSLGLSQIDINESNVADKLKLIIGTQAHLMILELLGTQSSDQKSRTTRPGRTSTTSSACAGKS